MSLPDDDLLAAVGEVLRCARGVVRTAHAQKIQDAVVPGWWDALERSLMTLDAIENAWDARGAETQ